MLYSFLDKAKLLLILVDVSFPPPTCFDLLLCLPKNICCEHNQVLHYKTQIHCFHLCSSQCATRRPSTSSFALITASGIYQVAVTLVYIWKDKICSYYLSLSPCWKLKCNSRYTVCGTSARYVSYCLEIQFNPEAK